MWFGAEHANVKEIGSAREHLLDHLGSRHAIADNIQLQTSFRLIHDSELFLSNSFRFRSTNALKAKHATMAMAAGQTTSPSPPMYAFIVAVRSQSCSTS